MFLTQNTKIGATFRFPEGLEATPASGIDVSPGQFDFTVHMYFQWKIIFLSKFNHQFKEMGRFYLKLNPFKDWSDPKYWQVKDKGFQKGFIDNDNEIENQNFSTNLILVPFNRTSGLFSHFSLPDLKF